MKTSRWSLLSDRSYDAVGGSGDAHTRTGSLSAVPAAGPAVVVLAGRSFEARRRRPQ